MPNKRKPNSIHHLQGTYKKSRHGDNKKKIQIDIEQPDPPSFITSDEIAYSEWQRVTKIMQKYGVLSALDRSVLSQYCVLWSKMATQSTDFSASEHTQLRLCAAELGITAVKRDETFTKDKSQDNLSGFERF